MKNLLLPLFVCLLISNSAIAQCESAEILSWQMTSTPVDTIADQTYEIQINAPDQSESYSLIVYSEYELGYNEEPPLIHVEQDGALDPGVSSIEVTIPASSINELDYFPVWHYFSASIQINCSGGGMSVLQKFYLSSHSMLNDPGFQCEEHFYNIVLPLPDDADMSYEAIMLVDSNSNETIETLEVFVDIGHTFASDFSIILESPSGTEVILKEALDGLGNQQSFSVLFQDGAPPVENFNEDIEAGPRGVFSPVEPLSTFAGENAAGVWKITVVDYLTLDDGLLAGVCLSINESPCIAQLSGTSYYDLNNNGDFDEGDEPLSISFVNSSLENYLITGNATGQYVDCSIAGSGVLELVNPPTYYTADAINFSVNEDDVLTDLDFPLIGIPGYYDLELDLFTAEPDVPGFTNTYYVQYVNVGTECIDDAVVSIYFPENMTVTDVSEPGAMNDGQTVTYEVGSICPLESGSFTLEVLLSDTTQMGSLVEVYAVIEPMLTDETPHNNEVNFESIVVAAYDPNDKLVDRSTIGATFMENNEPLKYTVRFQNTGTYLAQNVVITDTLDNLLEKTSFQLLAASHDVEVSFEENVAFFSFNDIMLPDSTTDLEGSKGFIRFSLKPQNYFAPGDIISNTANIYFDFNLPIITNTALTEYQFGVGQPENEISALVFPNPVNEQLQIQWPNEAGIQRIEVLDAVGKIIMRIPVQSVGQITIDSSTWTPGMYFLRFRSDRHLKPLRVVKN